MMPAVQHRAQNFHQARKNFFQTRMDIVTRIRSAILPVLEGRIKGTIERLTRELLFFFPASLAWLVAEYAEHSLYSALIAGVQATGTLSPCCTCRRRDYKAHQASDVL